MIEKQPKLNSVIETFPEPEQQEERQKKSYWAMGGEGFNSLKRELAALFSDGEIPFDVYTQKFFPFTLERMENFDSEDPIEIEEKTEEFLNEQRTVEAERPEEEKIEATPKEWKEKLKGLIDTFEGVKDKAEKAKEYLTERSTELGNGLKKFGLDVVGDFKAAGSGITHAVANPIETFGKIKTGAEKAKDYAGYFADRNKSFDEKSEKLKSDLKKIVEGYNKLPFRQKAYITAALIGSGALATAAGLPTLSSILAGGMYGQRVLGGAGFALKRREGIEARIEKKKLAGEEHWLEDKSNAFKNTYAGALGAAYMGGTAVAGHYAMEKLSDWLGHMFGHAATAPAVHADTSVHEAVPVTTPEVSVVPEVPHISVDASSGHGYEFMVKRLWEQLHGQHIDPSKFAAESDIHKLLIADASSIDKVVHQIAADPHHGFFNPETGASVQINPGDHMTIGADGQIHLGANIHAPAGAHLTPPYHPETSATPTDTSIKTHNLLSFFKKLIK